MKTISETQLKAELKRLEKRSAENKHYTLSETASLQGSILTVKKLLGSCKGKVEQ